MDKSDKAERWIKNLTAQNEDLSGNELIPKCNKDKLC